MHLRWQWIPLRVITANFALNNFAADTHSLARKPSKCVDSCSFFEFFFHLFNPFADNFPINSNTWPRNGFEAISVELLKAFYLYLRWRRWNDACLNYAISLKTMTRRQPTEWAGDLFQFKTNCFFSPKWTLSALTTRLIGIWATKIFVFWTAHNDLRMTTKRNSNLNPTAELLWNEKCSHIQPDAHYKQTT